MRRSQRKIKSCRAAGATIICAYSGRVLLIRRSRHVTNPFLWSVPAGGIDRGESAIHAAIRELEEETGYSGTLTLVYEESSDGFCNFGFVVPREFPVRLNWENDDADWFDPLDLPAPMFPGLRGFLSRMLS